MPQAVEESLGHLRMVMVVQVVLQERVWQRTVWQVVDVPVPQVQVQTLEPIVFVFEPQVVEMFSRSHRNYSESCEFDDSCHARSRVERWHTHSPRSSGLCSTTGHHARGIH